MANGKLERSRRQLEDALARLQEAMALDQPPSIRRDVIILRFVLAFETGSKRSARRCSRLSMHAQMWGSSCPCRYHRSSPETNWAPQD